MRPVVIPMLATAVVVLAMVTPQAPQRRPARKPVTRVVHIAGYRSGESLSLGGLVAGSDVILIGTAVAVVREDPVPVNATDPDCNLYVTCYLVEVERYLEWEGAPNQPPTIKVLVSGGAGSDGVMRVFEREPRLAVGGRYLLFLTDARPIKLGPNGEAIAFCCGAEGVEVYPDEYLPASPLHGIIQIQDGVTTLPQDPYQPDLQPWEFADDGTGVRTLLGLPENEAIQLVEQAIAEWAAHLREVEESMN